MHLRVSQSNKTLLDIINLLYFSVPNKKVFSKTIIPPLHGYEILVPKKILKSCIFDQQSILKSDASTHNSMFLIARLHSYL